MITGKQILTAATARLDREFVGWSRKHRLRQLAGKVRLAIAWQIPVGFEDETGFHLGAQRVRENDHADEERQGRFAYADQF
ncbi:MAG TPA: hypothetical protein VMA13_04820 [Candidatus Saccharimonadales bacterium]|nr:hypothetical protein [Candidatus Saccharimonadales bacterium]